MTTEPSPCHAGGNPLAASYFVDYWSAEEYTEYMGMFYYVTNAQGDVVALVDETGELLVTYSYDAWGNPVSTEYYEVDTDYGYIDTSRFVSHNPFRYRGYVYDTETGLYYLQSRYYDPEVGRFINGDAFAATGQGLVGNNMFVYCLNNPVNYTDDSGMRCMLATGRITVGILPEKKEEQTVIDVKEDVSSSIVNHVTKAHYYKELAMLDLGTLWGKVGFSTTTTKQSAEPGLLYSYSDKGNDASSGGVGVNARIIGADVGVSSELNAHVGVQLTPYLHGSLSLGLDGVGLVLGVDYQETSYDFEINGGWGIIALIFCPALAVSSTASGF